MNATGNNSDVTVKHNPNACLTDHYKQYFNARLIYRFINDYKLPISCGYDPTLFFYELEFFENTHGSLTKWIEVCDTIRDEYQDNPEFFVDAYMSVREQLIQDILHSDAYKAYCDNMDITNKYKNAVYPKCKYNTIYNQETCANGKRYWSFDMKHANYQIMMHENILPNVSYNSYIEQYCSGGLATYIQNSKYFRQVVFGKCNPSKTTKYEKACMLDIFNNCIKPVMGDIDIAVFNSDEVIIEAGTPEQYIQILDLLEKQPFAIRAEGFNIDGYEYYAYKEGQREPRKIGEFYKRSCDEVHKLMCVNGNYLKMVLNAYFNRSNTVLDKTVAFDKCTAIINEDITIKKIEK